MNFVHSVNIDIPLPGDCFVNAPVFDLAAVHRYQVEKKLSLLSTQRQDYSCASIYDVPQNNICTQKNVCINNTETIDSSATQRENPKSNKPTSGSLHCMYTNSDSMPNKMEELEHFLHDQNVDIAAITETIPKNCSQDEVLNLDTLPGYKCIHNQSGRGVCIYIKDSLNFTRCHELEKLFEPSVFCKVDSFKESFLIGAVYRSPNSNDAENNELLHQLKQVNSLSSSKGMNFVLLGDFNLPAIDWIEESCNKDSDHLASRFLEIVKTCEISQFVKSPTHYRAMQTPTLIDLVLTNNTNFIQNVVHFPPMGLSHHCVLTCHINFTTPKSSDTVVTKYLIDRADFDNMRADMSEILWNELLKPEDNVNVLWDCINSQVKTLMDKYVPIKKCKQNVFKRPFTAPASLLERVRLKRKAFKQYKKFPTVSNYNLYARYRNQVKWESKKAKRARENKIAKDAKLNPKAFFRYAASKTKNVDKVSNLKRKDGTITEDDVGKAEVLNDFFGSVFTKEDPNDIPTFTHSNTNVLSQINITTDAMSKALRNLKPSKSPGPDGLHPRILRELSAELAYPLKFLFDKSIQDGRLPDDWKKAEVRPIFKKGCKTTPGNYRPVSLTSVVCKVFEGFLRDSLYNHMIENNILSNVQHGFCKGRSCITQLLTTLQDWFQYLDKDIPVDTIYLDFRKAFDTASPKINKQTMWSWHQRPDP